MSATVTVIVPTLPNRTDLLQRALKSIAAQTYRDFETWILPDPGDPLAVDMEGAQVGRILLFGRHWPGYGGPKFLVAGYLAPSPYLAYCCDDNYWRPRHLELLMGAIGEADFAYSKTLFLGEEIGTDPPRHSQISLDSIVHRTDLLLWETWNPGYGYAIDWDLIERWMKMGATWRFLPEVTTVNPQKGMGV